MGGVAGELAQLSQEQEQRFPLIRIETTTSAEQIDGFRLGVKAFRIARHSLDSGIGACAQRASRARVDLQALFARAT
eukprot:6545816-Lingulodinium_polyedra.AAC.1